MASGALMAQQAMTPRSKGALTAQQAMQPVSCKRLTHSSLRSISSARG
jgi:hypothetical protein